VRISGSPLLTKAYKKQCLKYFVDKEVTSDETIKKVDEKSIKKGVTSIETVKTVDGRSITINENGTCSISKNENIISYEIISYEKSKYGSDCDITFKIKNNTTFGTIHKARLSVHAIDDKGKKIDSGSQYYPFSNKKPLKIGQETNGKFNVDTKCKYIKKIIVTDLFPLYCNIRKLPEDVNCYELVKIESLTDIPIEKL